jgi:hypothetical protein
MCGPIVDWSTIELESRLHQQTHIYKRHMKDVWSNMICSIPCLALYNIFSPWMHMGYFNSHFSLPYGIIQFLFTFKPSTNITSCSTFNIRHTWSKITCEKRPGLWGNVWMIEDRLKNCQPFKAVCMWMIRYCGGSFPTPYKSDQIINSRINSYARYMRMRKSILL